MKNNTISKFSLFLDSSSQYDMFDDALLQSMLVQPV